MRINIGIWKTALWQFVKMSDKKEWERLDLVSKWLIAARAAVAPVTLNSGAIAGLLALRDGIFDPLAWAIVTFGLCMAHGANNLLNDYIDFKHGIDRDAYFRTQYNVHPLAQGFWTERQQLAWFATTGALALLAGVYAYFYSGFHPGVLAIFAFGCAVLLFYSLALKHWGLGELAIFIVWGPVMVGGVYLVLAREWTPGVWAAALAGVPYGLCVASVNVAKHIDKFNEDKRRGINTFVVRSGPMVARVATIGAIITAYIVIACLVASDYFSTFVLLVLFALRRAFLAGSLLVRPRPNAPLPGFESFWPIWFSGLYVYHVRSFAALFMMGMWLDTFTHIITLPPALPTNALGLVSLGIVGLVGVYGVIKGRRKQLVSQFP